MALRLTTDSGERCLLETPHGVTDREAVHDLIRRTWLAARGWAQTSRGMVNLDDVVRIEAVSDEPALRAARLRVWLVEPARRLAGLGERQ